MSEIQKSGIRKLIKKDLKSWRMRENLYISLALAGMTAMIWGLRVSGQYNGAIQILQEAAKNAGIEV